MAHADRPALASWSTAAKVCDSRAQSIHDSTSPIAYDSTSFSQAHCRHPRLLRHWGIRRNFSHAIALRVTAAQSPDFEKKLAQPDPNPGPERGGNAALSPESRQGSQVAQHAHPRGHRLYWAV